MAGAQDTVDPIDAARNDIAGSKDLIASAVEDLSQHQRWLENYRAAETKHTRRLKRKALMHRLGEVLKRVLRALLNMARAVGRALRSAAIVLFGVSVRVVKAIGAGLVYLYGLCSRAMAWLLPRLRALLLATGRGLAAAFAWTTLRLNSFARGAAEEARIAYAWSARVSKSFARGAVEEARIAYAWSARVSKAGAKTARERAIAASAWTAPRARALASSASRAIAAALSVASAKGKQGAAATVEAASAGLAWLAIRSEGLARIAAARGSHGLAWLGAKRKTLSRASLAAASRGAAWAGKKGRELSAVAGAAAQRGAQGLKQASLAAQDRVSAAIAQGRGAAASLLALAPVKSAEPKDGPHEPAPQHRRGSAAAAFSARRIGSTPRAIRASRPALKQKPRVIGERDAAPALKRSGVRAPRPRSRNSRRRSARRPNLQGPRSYARGVDRFPRRPARRSSDATRSRPRGARRI